MLENKITELRKEKNLSQEQLAEILNTSRQAVSKWERGEAYPDIERLKELAIFFGVSIDYLLDYDIESLLLSNFIEKIKKVKNDSPYDVTIDEIKSMISKNSNNFDLLIYSINYLFAYWNKFGDNSVLELIIKYCKKGLAIYNKNNAMNIKIDDIKLMIAEIHQIRFEFDLAKEYLKDIEGSERDTMYAGCEIALGNYESAKGILTESFVHAFSNMVNASISQLRLFLRINEAKEAIDLALWCISFIKSVGKRENELIDILYIIYFYKAVAEKNLKIDWSESIKFLKDNYQIVKDLDNMRSVDFKLFDVKEADYYNAFEDSIQDALWKDVELTKGSFIYDDLVETYKCVFGGVGNE